MATRCNLNAGSLTMIFRRLLLESLGWFLPVARLVVAASNLHIVSQRRFGSPFPSSTLQVVDPFPSNRRWHFSLAGILRRQSSWRQKSDERRLCPLPRPTSAHAGRTAQQSPLPRLPPSWTHQPPHLGSHKPLCDPPSCSNPSASQRLFFLG